MRASSLARNSGGKLFGILDEMLNVVFDSPTAKELAVASEETRQVLVTFGRRWTLHLRHRRLFNQQAWNFHFVGLMPAGANHASLSQPDPRLPIQ